MLALIQAIDVEYKSAYGSPRMVIELRLRGFPVSKERVWASDISYLWTDEGWLYLAIVIDLFNREVVAGR